MSDNVKQLQCSIIAMGEILEDSVNALRGAPPDDCSWSTHDTAELVRKAAALANAYLAATVLGADEFDFGRLREAADAWRAVRAETLLQANQMIAWRDNPNLFACED
jgi:hypothetical protein